MHFGNLLTILGMIFVVAAIYELIGIAVRAFGSDADIDYEDTDGTFVD